jgi:hypothetical protein
MSAHFAARFVMIARGWILPLLLSHWTASRDAIRQ